MSRVCGGEALDVNIVPLLNYIDMFIQCKNESYSTRYCYESLSRFSKRYTEQNRFSQGWLAEGFAFVARFLWWGSGVGGFWITSRDAPGVLCPAAISLLSFFLRRAAGLGAPTARAALEQERHFSTPRFQSILRNLIFVDSSRSVQTKLQDSYTCHPLDQVCVDPLRPGSPRSK